MTRMRRSTAPNPHPPTRIALAARSCWRWLSRRSPVAEVADHLASLRLLRPTERRLVVAGDLALLLLVVVAVLVATVRPRLASLEFPGAVGSSGHDTVPWVSFVAAAVALVVGGALVLTGASNLRRLLFWLLLLATLVLVFVLDWAATRAGGPEIVTAWTRPIRLALLVAAVLAIPKRGGRLLRNHQGVEFVVWSLALALLVVGPASSPGGPRMLARGLAAGFEMIALAAIPILALLTLSAFWLVFSGSWAITGWLQTKTASRRRRGAYVLVVCLAGICLPSFYLQQVGPQLSQWHQKVLGGRIWFLVAGVAVVVLYMLQPRRFMRIARWRLPVPVLGFLPSAAGIALVWFFGQEAASSWFTLAVDLSVVSFFILLGLPFAGSWLWGFVRVIAMVSLSFLWLDLLLISEQGSLEETLFTALGIPAVVVLAASLIVGLLQLGSWFATLEISTLTGRGRTAVATIVGWLVLLFLDIYGPIRSEVVHYLLLIVLLGGVYVLVGSRWVLRQVTSGLSRRPPPGVPHRVLLWQGGTILAVASAIYLFSIFKHSVLGEAGHNLSLVAQTVAVLILGAWLVWGYRHDLIRMDVVGSPMRGGNRYGWVFRATQRQNGPLLVQRKSGHGTVEVVEEPSSAPVHVEVDATRLPFADQSFAIIWASHLIEPSPAGQRVLRELRRVLAPEGWLLLTSAQGVMVAGGWPGTEELAKTADWPGAETLAVLHSAGFEHITVRESPPN